MPKISRCSTQLAEKSDLINLSVFMPAGCVPDAIALRISGASNARFVTMLTRCVAVPRNQVASGVDQHRIGEAKMFNRTHQLLDLSLTMDTRIAGPGDKTVGCFVVNVKLGHVVAPSFEEPAHQKNGRSSCFTETARSSWNAMDPSR